MRTTWQPLSNETKPPTFLLALTFLFLFSGSSVVFGGYLQDGFDAYDRKDYKEAVRFYRLSAEQGEAPGQYGLGQMYSQGLGVPQDYKEAVKWYRLSAEQGYAEAQDKFGLMHAKGQGVPQDYVSAHMWWNLAGSNGNESALDNRNLVEEQMTPQQIEKAKEMARNWKPKK